MTDDRHIDGYDPTSERPYADVDIEDLPAWWRRAIADHDAADGPTYLPARFADGTIVQPVIRRLEAMYDVDVTLVGVGVRHGDPWTIRVDGRDVATVERERTRAGETRYGITVDRFEEIVSDAIEMG
ncbi:hypothetical protein [Halopenitus persicus]|uniref:hypothetical protein n=1 Tax=Halopenitus persicus TaxID=1048396 RepID=UPI000BBB0AEB|nr:hypothetical protein [Halopenitus persicus]